VEPLLEVLTLWWWTAPTAVGLGAVGYVGLTTGRRRARRLALDAARHEEGAAARALMAARAHTRSAQAQLLTAQAQRRAPAAGVPSVAEARRLLQRAREAQRSAMLELKASRSRVRAERARLHVARGEGGLPLARLVHEHDALLGRWIEYETDVETALAFPQMTDAQHPATAAFLHAQRDAQWLRPPSGAARMSPADFVAYRDAVRALERAFTAAEDDALRSSARRVHLAPRTSTSGRDADAVPPRRATPAQQPAAWPVPRRDAPGPTAPGTAPRARPKPDPR
jgi:hypothetical protein